MVELLIDALVTYRLARLVTTDKLTAPWRRRFVRAQYARRGEMVALEGHLNHEPAHDDWIDQASLDGTDAPLLAQLITCPWCASVWIAGGVAVARVAAPRTWRVVGNAVALAGAAGLFGALERSLGSLEELGRPPAGWLDPETIARSRSAV